MLKLSDIVRVQQSEFYDCGAACLSMVTGIPLEKVKAEMYVDKCNFPYSIDEVSRFLTRHDIFIEHCNGIMNTNLMEGSVYFCVGKSPTGIHSVICKVSEDGISVLDPSREVSETEIINYYHLTDCSLPGHLQSS